MTDIKSVKGYVGIGNEMLIGALLSVISKIDGERKPDSMVLKIFIVF